ncbi:MAG: DNA polymerase III subunit beta [Microgenomates group bacterium]|nr:DNA polymerase III subunit beta [Microgenomates group bacterium]
MRITVDGKRFLEKISLANRFTSYRLLSSSSLQGVLIKSEEKGIGFFSTNLNSYFVSFLELKNKKNDSFNIVVEPKKIIEFLSLLPPGEINIEITNNQVIINKEKTKGSFPLLEEKDFPLPPKTKGKGQKIPASFFKKIALVLFSSSSDISRPVLTGVNFVSQEEETKIVTTDGFRLSLLKTKRQEVFPQAIIPAETLGEVLKIITDEEGVLVNYLSEEKMLAFSLGESTIFSRLIEGEFPPFEKVIPTERKTVVEVDREELQQKIKIISVFVREKSNVIILDFQKEGLYLRSRAEEKDQNTAFQEIGLEGEEQKVAFNFKFLLDFLNQVGGEKIFIEILRSDAPVVFKSDKIPEYLHIIMPVRIQEEG